MYVTVHLTRSKAKEIFALMFFCSGLFLGKILRFQYKVSAQFNFVN